MSNICKNCKNVHSGDFCSNCGRPTNPKRIDGQYILNEIGSVLSFEKGFLFTIKGLLTKPGKNIREFITDDRNRLIKPIIFIIICSLIYTIAVQLFHVEDGYIKFGSSDKSTTALILEWIQNNYGYANILIGVFITLWIKILFKKYHYNFFEILILLCFVMGVGMLIFAFFGILEALLPLKLMQIGGFVGTLYATWAIGQFFDKGKIINYLKAFISYLLGMITFSFAALALGFVIDLIIKK